MQQAFPTIAAFFRRCLLAVSAAGLIGVSTGYAQVEGREDPFGRPTTPPDTTPPAIPVPMPAVPGEQPAPVPAPAPGPAPEAPPFTETEPYVPQDTPAEEQIKLGMQLMEQGQSDLAIQHFEEATKLAAEPLEKANAFYHLGNAFRALNRLDDAIDAYSDALTNDPDDAEAYLHRGIAWFYKGEYAIATDDFDDAGVIFLHAEPYAELWKGLAKARQGQWLDAVNAYAVAILGDPQFSLAYTNRGLAYLQLDEPDKALTDFNQAIRHEPRNAVHYFRRGIAQTRVGRIQDAIISYDEALRLNPEYSDARANRSLLQGRAGR